MPTPTPFRPIIQPPIDNATRPLWSVMIPTYNSARYLGTTLESVLSQDPGPDVIQIEVVDDHSTTDDPESTIRGIAGDRVGFYRQAANVGHVGNFNTCLTRSRGQLIHLLHGDDYVLAGFYKTMQDPLIDNPALGSAWCRQIIIDEDGRWVHVSSLFQRESGIIPDWLDSIAIGQRLQAPSMVVRRSVLGRFDQRIRAYGEDWEMWVRIASRYPAWHEVQPLAAYRYFRDASLTARTVRTGLSARDLQRVVRINLSALPAEREAYLTAQAREANAIGSAKWAIRMADAGQLSGAFIQLREALRYTLARRVVVRVFAVTAYVLVRMVERFFRLATRRLGPRSILAHDPGRNDQHPSTAT